MNTKNVRGGSVLNFKPAFSMIELVFVIVILGVLAAIAIPKLAATREDAEILKAYSDRKTLIKDIETYYYAQGKMDHIIDGRFSFKKMSNIVLPPYHNGDDLGRDCLDIVVPTAPENVITIDYQNLIAKREKTGASRPGLTRDQKVALSKKCERLTQMMLKEFPVDNPNDNKFIPYGMYRKNITLE